MIIVDSHPHIYSADEQRYPPIEKPLRPPEGTGTPEHLRREMEANGVHRAVVIQTSTFYRWDNRFICHTVQLSKDWATGVVTLNPDDPHSSDLLYSLVRRYGVRGLRSIPAADGSYDHPGVRALWEEAMGLGTVVNALIPLKLADELATLLGQFSGLRVVLDHCLNLAAGEDYQATLNKVLELSRYPNLHAKLTFIPTGSREEYPCQDMHDACKRIIQAFTPDRCVWGSDFPCQLWCPRVTYSEHLRIFTHELALSESEKEAILGKTALRLWFGAREA